MWVKKGPTKVWLGPRPVEPSRGGPPVLLLSDDARYEAVTRIVAAIVAEHRRERAQWENAIGRELCEACGCLCLPDEHCPMCLVARGIAA